METKEYAKAADYWFRSLKEIIDPELTEPWAELEQVLQERFIANRDALQSIHNMADGLIVSQALEANQIMQSVPNPDEQNNAINVAMIAMTSTVLLRAFALGVKAQRTADEIGKLEVLFGGD